MKKNLTAAEKDKYGRYYNAALTDRDQVGGKDKLDQPVNYAVALAKKAKELAEDDSRYRTSR